ncbi:MAG TPA: hypothetical protein VFX03_03785, partial [Thermomicrobiales bacterium]|nr:hypothetical protein [Thermomicrobiales bacterium]
AAAPFAYLDGATLHVEYAPSITSVTIGNDGSGHLTATENGTTLSFAAGSINDILVSSASGSDNTVAIAATLGKPLAVNSASGNDTIEVQSGASQSFDADAGASAANLNIIIDPDASAIFGASQHLAGLTINGIAQVSAGSGATLVTQNLAVSGSLDLTDNDLIVVGGDLGTFSAGAYTGVTGLVASGAIASSSAQARYTTLGVATAGDALSIAGSQTAIFDGQTVSPGDVLVKFTYVGDANLDGKVNIDDYGRIDGNVGQSGTVFGWFNGDFNYDGKINIDDYGLIDSVIGSQGAVL